eukprot:365015-Chlamydomonas_euryale.AAC.4
MCRDALPKGGKQPTSCRHATMCRDALPKSLPSLPTATDISANSNRHSANSNRHHEHTQRCAAMSSPPDEWRRGLPERREGQSNSDPPCVLHCEGPAHVSSIAQGTRTALPIAKFANALGTHATRLPWRSRRSSSFKALPHTPNPSVHTCVVMRCTKRSLKCPHMRIDVVHTTPFSTPLNPKHPYLRRYVMNKCLHAADGLDWYQVHTNDE